MKIIQVMNALDYGDGVSNSVVNTHRILKEMGYETAIYAKYFHEKQKKYYNNIEKLKANKDDILIHHYSGESIIQKKINSLNCRKVFLYHNLTPKGFFNQFDIKSDEHVSVKQMQLISKHYNFFVGDSEYNAKCLSEIINIDSQIIDILPIVEEFKSYNKKGATNNLLNKNDEIIFLFVGRVAPNKKQEDIIEIFEFYNQRINPSSTLFLVGNDKQVPTYTTWLNEKVNEKKSKNKIHFVGKIGDDLLHEYYKISDIFICMSEHEGFCIPLLESMSYGIPTIAYDAGAVNSTMGNSGVLVYKKDPEIIAKLCQVIITNSEIRNKIIDKQNKWLNNFSYEIITENLRKLIMKWSN